MKSVQSLYHIAEQKNIVVDRFALFSRDAMSIMGKNGKCFVAIDPSKIRSETDERCKLSHELGHCITGAFYNQYSNYDCRRKHENRADKWAVKHLIPVDELDEAIADGHTELWDLADHFGVTEDFIRKAVCLYVYGNIAVESYFLGG